MTHTLPLGTLIPAALAAFLLVPSPARAQFYAGAYLGADHTHPADVTIDQPAIGRSLTFEDVEFEGRPFQSPQYYGWRVGYLLGRSRRFGVEVEFLHLKVIALTDRTYAVSGTTPDDAVLAGPMQAIVQRYSMTHGHNFLFVNLVSRTPVGQSPVAVVLRSGIGPTLPHAESTIDHATREQYEYGGMGAQVAAGVDVRLLAALSAIVEYKFTYARPEITVVGGAGRTRTATHHVAAGLAFGLPR